MSCRLAATALALLISTAVFALGHGVSHHVSEGAMAVTATYDDGSPMAFCDVCVFAPGATKEPYQDGTSDRHGCFAFLPDTNGTWRVTVDDGMGHLANVSIEVGAAGSMSAADSPRHEDRLSRVAVGIGIIFGCFGLYAMFAARAQGTRRRGQGDT